ncbi:palmitoyltransferase ZDHHC11 isoform X2 [Gouania willdenowi]|uniref:Palmitoyltransferase n=1 Tax=Gouania willdenowi TaxID=441366 RepID=A0A8C5EUH0_GOUWI|nr:probable palmitoyltransferase ZDHHC11 isoform X2 [Gouania willdenowi]
MNCFSKRLRRTAPIPGSSHNDLIPSTPPRRNGWSWPLQVFQLIGWLVYSYIAIVSFGIYIPLLPPPWNHVAYALTGSSFIVHFLAHIAAVTIDPADASVRVKHSYASPMPLFDRTKQQHVIQDLHCYLCDVNVGPKVKHCSICNKCVESFDHHCKWLNNCVGGRNYRFFFVAMSSATVGTILVIVVVLFVFIQHYLDPHILRTAPQFDSLVGNTTWLVFLPFAPIKTSSAGLLIIAFVTVMLSITCLLLIGPLLVFHLYLLSKGISTYDHIKIQRQKKARKQETHLEPHDSKPYDKSPQIKDSPVDCQSALSHGSSSCQIDNEASLAGRFSESVCAEMENFQRSSKKVKSFRNGSTTHTQNRERNKSMKTMESWNPDSSEEAQSSSVRSSESVPRVQDPLGSSVMTSDYS